MTIEPGSVPGRRRPDRAALSIAVLLIAVAAIIIWDMQRIKLAGAYDRIGPTTVPYVVAGGLILLAIGTAIQGWRGSFPAREPQSLSPVIIIVAALVLQMILLPFAGFTVATGVLFALTAYGFGERRLYLSLPFGLLLSGFVWFVFARLLKLTLPEGPPERLVLEWLKTLAGAG